MHGTFSIPPYLIVTCIRSRPEQLVHHCGDVLLDVDVLEYLSVPGGIDVHTVVRSIQM